MKTMRLLVFFCTILISLAGCSDDYPKTEQEARLKLLNKYWRAHDFSIDEIYVDGEKVKKPSGNLREIVSEKNSNTEMYAVLENAFKDKVKKDNFVNFREINSESILSFDLSFDDDNDQYTYETSNVKMIHDGILSKYVIKYPDGFQFSQRAKDGEFVDGTTYNISGYRSIIEVISDDELKLLTESTIELEEQKIRIIYTQTLKPYQPSGVLTGMINKELLKAVEFETTDLN
jgi:hypothetical protein